MVFLQTGLNFRKNALDFGAGLVQSLSNFDANLVVIFSNGGRFIQHTRWLGVSFLKKNTRVEKNFLQLFSSFLAGSVPLFGADSSKVHPFLLIF